MNSSLIYTKIRSRINIQFENLYGINCIGTKMPLHCFDDKFTFDFEIFPRVVSEAFCFFDLNTENRRT